MPSMNCQKRLRGKLARDFRPNTAPSYFVANEHILYRIFNTFAGNVLHLLGRGDIVGQLEDAALPQNALPHLDADDAEYEEDEKAQQQHVAQHRQRVQQQHHQNAHTFFCVWCGDVAVGTFCE